MGSDTKIDFYADIIKKSGGYAEKAIRSGIDSKTQCLRKYRRDEKGHTHHDIK
jgi:hypothetical protein